MGLWGRPSRDWDKLFRDWVYTDMPKSTFLESRGIKPTHGSTIKATSNWHRAAKFLKENKIYDLTKLDVAELFGISVQDGQGTGAKRKSDDDDPNLKQMVAQEIEAQKERFNEIERIKTAIFDFRKNQALSDFKLADNIKTHIKIYLNNSVTRHVDSNGREKVETNLTTSQIRQIVYALEGVQKIQRLALGMTTENIGIEPHLINALETSQNADDNCPVFEVQVNKDGKFEKARPTQVA